LAAKWESTSTAAKSTELATAGRHQRSAPIPREEAGVSGDVLDQEIAAAKSRKRIDDAHQRHHAYECTVIGGPRERAISTKYSA